MNDIAVLMSVYNPGSKLHLTLDSLRAQTVPFTLYLVDDGSVTKPDYAALLAGFDYRLIELSRNWGISIAVNCGLSELMKNDHAYVARMDCGDIAHPERLEVQRRFLDARPDVGILGDGRPDVRRGARLVLRFFYSLRPTQRSGARSGSACPSSIRP